jgi:hypothetical protein
MVKVSEHGGRRFHVCEECGLGYETSELAQECEEYCSANSSCSLEITRHAVYVPESK